MLLDLSNITELREDDVFSRGLLPPPPTPRKDYDVSGYMSCQLKMDAEVINDILNGVKRRRGEQPVDTEADQFILSI